MNSIDLLMVLLAAAYAITGFAQGFIVNLAGTLGLLLSGVIAVVAVPKVVDNADGDVGTSLLALGIVVGAAAIGQVVGTMIGQDAKEGIRSKPAQGLDSVGGAALGVGAVLIAGWALGYSVSGSQIPYLSQASRESSIMRAVDGYIPEPGRDVLRSFNRVVDANLFPSYIDPFEPEEIVETGPPDPATLNSPGVRAARASVVKILGEAVCGHGIEGSGFVYAPGRVMTNAHVVGGVPDPVVITDNGQFEARTVVFDPQLDLAVLAVPGLDLTPLAWNREAQAGDDAAILGYPGNGPFDARAARIREQITLRSPDIYGRGQVDRGTFAIRGLVRSGNSGGPLVGKDGRVLGVIFAASVKDSSTGYAVTASQAAANAAKGIERTAEVDTAGCA